MKTIIDLYGVDVLLNERRFLSIFSDVAPKLINERKVISIILSENVAPIIMDGSIPVNERISIIQLKLSETLSNKSIDTFIESVIFALNWPTSLYVPLSSTKESKISDLILDSQVPKNDNIIHSTDPIKKKQQKSISINSSQSSVSSIGSATRSKPRHHFRCLYVSIIVLVGYMILFILFAKSAIASSGAGYFGVCVSVAVVAGFSAFLINISQNRESVKSISMIARVVCILASISIFVMAIESITETNVGVVEKSVDIVFGIVFFGGISVGLGVFCNWIISLSDQKNSL